MSHTTNNTTADEDDDNFASIRLFLGDKLAKDDAPVLDTAAVTGKVSAPSDTNTEIHAVRMLLDAYNKMISIPPKTARKHCIGEARPDEHLVTVSNPVHTIAYSSGKSRSGTTYLDPEEWLVFFERGSLKIRDTQTQRMCSLADVWTKAVDSPWFKMHGYRAYSILRRLGYAVVVCSPEESHVCRKPTTSTVPSANAGRYASVFRGLLQHAPLSMNSRSFEEYTHAYSDCAASIKSYSVYMPTTKYTKRNAPTPQHTLVAQAASDRVPSAGELMRWDHYSNHDSSALVCVSEPGSTAYLSIKAIEIQNLQN
ncbi:hypothetical protein EV175_005312 [Coemansia sp. RSA 1933]|nr:hypothetical protein EV175_005312 [Coemansia sp. RSA 1933]